MLVLSLAVLAALTGVCVAALALRGSRRRRPALAPWLDPLPAGRKHLASTVSELSDLELHLPAARLAALGHKPRLGALLDLRQP